MNKNLKLFITLVAINIALLFVFREYVPEALGGKSNTKANNSSKQQNSSYSDKLKIKDGSGAERLVIKNSKDKQKLEINFNGTQIVLKANNYGKRKYKKEINGSEKDLIAEIKSKSTGFKLVNSNDQLLWKVKLDPSKIKISNNDENKNAWELVNKEGKIKVRRPDGTEAGSLKVSSSGTLKLKSSPDEKVLFSASNMKLSASLGVLMLEHIPFEQRCIIATELLRLGK